MASKTEHSPKPSPSASRHSSSLFCWHLSPHVVIFHPPLSYLPRHPLIPLNTRQSPHPSFIVLAQTLSLYAAQSSQMQHRMTLKVRMYLVVPYLKHNDRSKGGKWSGHCWGARWANGQVVGVKATKLGEKEKYRANLVIIADGCFSNFCMTAIGSSIHKLVTRCHFVSAILEDASLPIQNHFSHPLTTDY